MGREERLFFLGASNQGDENVKEGDLRSIPFLSHCLMNQTAYNDRFNN
jgi:hypothetical protein